MKERDGLRSTGEPGEKFTALDSDSDNLKEEIVRERKANWRTVEKFTA